jgi:hypothetical protein
VRCLACNKILNDFELTRKFSGSGEFVDLCNGCGKFLIEDDVTVEGNLDFAHLSDMEELYDVEDGELDHYSGTELGEEDLW